MRVGLLTSWRVPCGIYQYSARLADAMARHPELEPVILAGRADKGRSVPEESDHEVYDVGRIGLWNDNGKYTLDVPFIGSLDLDVIHVQYQSMLFTQPHLEALRRERGWYNGLLAITFHDNCQAPDFPYDAFDLHFSHRWNIGPASVEIIPFGVEDRPPVIRSFGLGRTQSELIAPICERHGWIYESAATNEPIHGIVNKWRAHEELIQWLRGADAIVLWYPNVDQAGESQAARTAIATRRPVFTNDTKWFEDLPNKLRTASEDTYSYKCPDLETLEVRLIDLFIRSYVRDNSWDVVADKLHSYYSKVKMTA